ncbi:MAG: hypothetical protein U9R75_10920 [Candidatus Thermoplasmatota archaeon]|nr:hypothetical protein [Candidatus Thermoplasmatota archaeon]
MVQDDIGHPKEVWIRRKLFHVTLGTFLVLCMILDDRTKWLFLLLLTLGIPLSVVQERMNIPVITWFLNRYDKRGDRIPGQGPVAFFVGALFVWFIFGGELAIACVIALSFGDPTAYIMGRSIPGPKLPWNRNKTLAGTLSFIVSPFILISLIWSPFPALIIAVSAAAAESLPWPNRVLLDDNITVPIISSIIGWMLIDVLPSFL